MKTITNNQNKINILNKKITIWENELLKLTYDTKIMNSNDIKNILITESKINKIKIKIYELEREERIIC